MDSLAGAIGFLTTLPLGRDEKSFESFRRRIYVMPLAGVIAGAIAGLLCYFFSLFGLQFLSPLAIVGIEGINHLDGLADFGDAVFAPEGKKLKAMKDLNVGCGGNLAISMWAISISLASLGIKPPWLFLTALIAEVSAKSSMLLLMSTTKPAWEGMGSYMAEFANSSAAIAVVLAGVFAVFIQLTGYPAFFAFLASMALTAILRQYFIRKFNGISGDMLGAVNCIAVAACFVFARVMACSQL